MAELPHEPTRDQLTGPVWVARWAGPVFIVCSLVLIPWIIYLGFSLPSRAVSHHYDAAWVGFDVMELMALAATGIFAFRRSRYLAVSAAAASTLLIVDAWFDVLTSNRHQLAMAIVLAVVIELPLAAVCAWLSFHTETLAQQQLTLLLGRVPLQEPEPADRRGSG